jgi:hypothetical protein
MGVDWIVDRDNHRQMDWIEIRAQGFRGMEFEQYIVPLPYGRMVATME